MERVERVVLTLNKYNIAALLYGWSQEGISILEIFCLNSFLFSLAAFRRDQIFEY